MSAKAPVDLVVGIDFGMTCTGVAYSTTKLSNPRVIQRWPGKEAEAINKVPSSVVYHPKGPLKNKVKDWGFKSQNVDGTIEWFKRYLDPERITALRETARKRRIEGSQRGLDILPESDILDYDEIKRYYKDFMQSLYIHISKVIQGKTGDWNSKRVEFIFSLPCTFKKPGIGHCLSTLIKEAGFGSEGKLHTVGFGLTEPEAAAVFTIKESAVNLEPGTTILVCDAGGGTTDLAVLQSTTKDGEELELEALDFVEGKNVGSVNIDIAFEKMVEQRLSAVKPSLPDNTAWSMMHSSEFLVWKCQDDSEGFTSIPIIVPTVKSNFNHRKAKIANGKMLFSQSDFQALFDPPVEELIRLISARIESLKRSHPNKNLDYVVLSGGLGSSAYVYSRLKVAFDGSRDQPKLQILLSEEPQLAVVKGLVIDRIQKLSTGKAMLKSRKCRASYGIQQTENYREEKHVGQKWSLDYAGTKIVENQIKWIIHKGETIDSETPMTHISYFTFLPSDNDRASIQSIFMSWNDRESLPTNTNHDDANLVGNTEFYLSDIGLDKLKVRRCPEEIEKKYGHREYHQLKCETKIMIGAADLKFEVWCSGKRYGEERVSIDWA